MNCNVPVVLVIFNRYDSAKKVFERIREVKPPKLFVLADGPRAGKTGEAEKVAKTRTIINDVDWPCEVITNFSETNMGCKQRISTGLNWVFDQTDRAIILEDDCYPDISFFQFAEELLEKYKNDTRIMQISGENKILKPVSIKTSYYFTRSVEIWGWATWARAWKKADMEMKNWPEIRKSGIMKQLWVKKSEAYHWTRLFDKIYNNEFNSWAARWCYSVAKESGISIAPSVNLVTNIGTDSEDATHGDKNSPYANAKRNTMQFPLNHPEYVMINPELMELERKSRVIEQEKLPYPLNKWASLCKRTLYKILGK